MITLQNSKPLYLRGERMRKTLPFICIIFIITSCLFGILYFSSPKSTLEARTPTPDIYVSTLSSKVYSGIITSTITSTGFVINNAPDIYIENIHIEHGKYPGRNEFILSHNIGDILNKGDLFYVYDKEEVHAAFDCKIIDVVYTETSIQISLLNYEKLFVVTSLDYENLSLLNYGTKASVMVTSHDTTKYFDANIIYLGYEINNRKVDVHISTNEKLLPGTPVNVAFEIVHETESLYILKSMLMMDGNTYYVEVQDNSGERTRRDVELGDFFDVYTNGQNTEFVEIKNGLTEGECLVVDMIG